MVEFVSQPKLMAGDLAPGERSCVWMALTGFRANRRVLKRAERIASSGCSPSLEPLAQ